MSTPHRTDHETGLDALDPARETAQDATGFRQVVAAAERVDTARRELDLAVRAAREAGTSWSVIGAALGTTRQAAQQRFGGPSAG